METFTVLPKIHVRWTSETPDGRTKRQPRQFNGPKEYKPTRKTFTHSDNEILEMRRLHEVVLMNAVEITTYMNNRGVKVNRGTVYSIVNYAYRSHLIPSTDPGVTYLP